jgi:hypothetical protein
MRPCFNPSFRRGSESAIFGLQRASGSRLPVGAGWRILVGWAGGWRRRLTSAGSGSLRLKWSKSQQRQPMRMALAGHHFAGAFAVALGAPAAHEAPVVEEEPEQVEVRVAEVAAQREIGAQPRVEVLHQRTAARCLRHALVWLFQRLRRWNLGQPRPADSVEQRVELAPIFVRSWVQL